MKVFLIGYMGVGKTTIGSKLAKSLEIPFIDLDQHIEKQENRSISQIFSQEGEPYFRELEAEMIQEISGRDANFILSTGGGTPIWRDNMLLMNDSGCTVWLRMPAKMIFKRLEQGREHRPLISGLTDEELMEFIERSLSKREPYYAEANIIHSAIDNDARAISGLANLIRSHSK